MNGYGDCHTCKSFSKSAFSCLSKDFVSKSITANSVSLSFKKGQDIYIENTLSKGVYCIQSGKVKIYKGCAERNMTIGLAGNSDLIGYQTIFNGDNFTNSAKCLEDSQICFIPKKNFLNIITSNSEMQMQLIKRCCIDNYKLSNILRDLKCKNTLSRIATALLALGEKFGFDENKCLNVTLTRKDISEISGTTTESAIRILNDLKREKVLVFYNNRIRIQDTNKLLRYQKG